MSGFNGYECWFYVLLGFGFGSLGGFAGAFIGLVLGVYFVLSKASTVAFCAGGGMLGIALAITAVFTRISAKTMPM